MNSDDRADARRELEREDPAPTGEVPERTDQHSFQSAMRPSATTTSGARGSPPAMLSRCASTMQERRTGRIAPLSSLGSRNGGLLSGAKYAASKGALSSFVRVFFRACGYRAPS